MILSDVLLLSNKPSFLGAIAVEFGIRAALIKLTGTCFDTYDMEALLIINKQTFEEIGHIIGSWMEFIGLLLKPGNFNIRKSMKEACERFTYIRHVNQRFCRFIF